MGLKMTFKLKNFSHADVLKQYPREIWVRLLETSGPFFEMKASAIPAAEDSSAIWLWPASRRSRVRKFRHTQLGLDSDNRSVYSDYYTCTRRDRGSAVSNASFGATIRALREAQKISLRKFAEKVDISPTYLSKIERDEFPPPAEDVVRKFADALNQDHDELLALAGRVSSDLPEIIRERPRELATFLRSASDLSPEEMAKLTRYLERMKRPT